MMKVDIVGTVSYSEAVETGSFVPDCGATMDSAHLDRRKFLQRNGIASSPTTFLHQATHSNMLDPGLEHL